MPCHDAYSYFGDAGRESDALNEVRQRLDHITRLICSLCERLEGSGFNHLIYADPQLLAWWDKHQECDRRRKAEELAEEKRQQAKQRALAKLTPEERRLLNLGDS